jgi:L-aspartate oxidase
MEFMQFHPTALEVERDPLPLITEALRGEGAHLHDETGRRFMPQLHADAELAPRDVVARAIFAQQQAGHSVSLDATMLGASLTKRFATAFEACMRAGIDPRATPIPVRPAAHYTIGGVAVDEWGRSSLPGLWACGEASSTGIHGANRLASNSLLEALVFAARVARNIEEANAPEPRSTAVRGVVHVATAAHDPRIAKLRALMYERVGLVRNERDLAAALIQIADLDADAAPKSAELSNLLTVGQIVVQAALDRRESRGCHYREDYPQTQPEWAHRSFSRLAHAS